jgi:O-antigen ligase
MAHRIPWPTPGAPAAPAPAHRITFLALVILGAGAPLLPTTALKVTATLYAALVLAGGWYARFRTGDPLGRTPLDVPTAAFLLTAVLATLFSPNPSLSVLPSSLRGDGLLEYIAYTAAALTAARLGRPQARSLLIVLVSSGTIVGGIAVAQYYGLDVTQWTARMGALPTAQSAGTLGNRIFLGGYLSLLLPVGIAFAADTTERRWQAYAAASGVVYAALVASQTRAAWVGYALGGVLLARLLAGSPGALKRLIFLGAAFASITAVMVLTQPHGTLAERALSTFNLGDPSLEGRVVVWRQTLSLILHRPIFGWGFSTHLGQFPGMGSPGSQRVAADEPAVMDTTHNEILHVAYITGVAGLGAYL